jgi:hypothetical protein
MEDDRESQSRVASVGRIKSMRGRSMYLGHTARHPPDLNFLPHHPIVPHPRTLMLRVDVTASSAAKGY